jgi:transcriptional regulator with XRE-family HTH domain
MRLVDVVSQRLASDNEHVIDPLVAARIKKLREQKGWKQSDLAKNAGVATNTVGGLEHGRQTRWTQFEKIAKALGTTPEAIQRGDGVSEDNPLLRKLNDEDLRIGNAYHDAETKIRVAVDRLLRLRAYDPMFRFWERVQELDDRRRETLLQSLEQHEKALADERAAKNKPKKP